MQQGGFGGDIHGQIPGLGANGYGDHSPDVYGLLAALVAETALTAFLVNTVLGATHRAAPVGFAGLAIGLVLTFIHLVSIPVTNTSVNPAQQWSGRLRAGLGAEPALGIHRGAAGRHGDRGGALPPHP